MTGCCVSVSPLTAVADGWVAIRSCGIEPASAVLVNTTGGRSSTVALVVCSPATPPSVRSTAAVPSAPVTTCAWLTLPPPATVQRTVTPSSGSPASSSTSTTSGAARGSLMSPTCPLPLTSTTEPGWLPGSLLSLLQRSDPTAMAAINRGARSRRRRVMIECDPLSAMRELRAHLSGQGHLSRGRPPFPAKSLVFGTYVATGRQDRVQLIQPGPRAAGRVARGPQGNTHSGARCIEQNEPVEWASTGSLRSPAGDSGYTFDRHVRRHSRR